jgi:RecA-family ATPase
VLELPETNASARSDPNVRIFLKKKANYALRDDEIKLRWHNGVLVLHHVGASDQKRRPVEQVFLDHLDRVTGENRHVSDNNHAGNYAPKIFAMRSDSEGYTKADFAKGMERLFEWGEIINARYGRKGDARCHIVRRSAATQTAEAAE